MLELQALGAALVALPEAQLHAMALEPELLAAVLEAKRIKSHEAKRRQMQYIGRLMRDVDAAPIRARWPSSRAARRRPPRATAASRRWRERLIGDDEALTAFAAEHPGADLQALRTLIRNARKEQKEGKPPRAYRELFRVLKDIEAPAAAQG